MYAIVKTGGKQYRVEQGESLLVERLPLDEGKSLTLDPLLYVDGSKVIDQVDGLSSVSVEARVVGHERGPKLRIVKFKPKRGYKRRTGHRQELTRIEVVGIKMGGGGRARGSAKAASEAEPPAPVAAEGGSPAPETPKAAAKPRAAAKPKAAATEKADAAAKAGATAKKPPAPKKPPAADKPKAPRTRAPKKTSEEASDGT